MCRPNRRRRISGAAIATVPIFSPTRSSRSTPNTGKRLWHFQIVHHDLLDKDLPTPPVLLTVTQNGTPIDAVAQGTKHGLLFVFDRVTGRRCGRSRNAPVPQTTLPGEQTWPTQPFPTKPAPLMRQTYTAADVSTISPTRARRRCMQV